MNPLSFNLFSLLEFSLQPVSCFILQFSSFVARPHRNIHRGHPLELLLQVTPGSILVIWSFPAKLRVEREIFFGSVHAEKLYKESWSKVSHGEKNEKRPPAFFYLSRSESYYFPSFSSSQFSLFLQV